eukprot:Protomagalhaensia_sp_Gyna_25__5871@NODE_883_length_2464_cov_13_664742_g696_i0_p1_GENE_NODE_883_length_2464_cov_13_664742_g696_i0NODE_883_length_2464_cov_13_664742_g696_i0_p1_ORF_typecomplete_len303_score82_99MAD/PF05557_13/1_7e06APG6_N/PF17675_1/0_56APG6_N/PF17675_1/0_019APG6_N/PF17675_1/0_078APG6_N/PF17675_1/1_5DUF3584/PF12128_8/4_9e05Myosin_tail_1/PF01576_19/0_00038Filament/PF00038_21/0_034Filament/PF00038_21/0_062Filament/PF00038_21/6_9DUF4407/PF14362_6/0_0037DUF4407/PF14362_6/6_8e02T3SSipB/P
MLQHEILEAKAKFEHEISSQLSAVEKSRLETEHLRKKLAHASERLIATESQAKSEMARLQKQLAIAEDSAADEKAAAESVLAQLTTVKGREASLLEQLTTVKGNEASLKSQLAMLKTEAETELLDLEATYQRMFNEASGKDEELAARTQETEELQQKLSEARREVQELAAKLDQLKCRHDSELADARVLVQKYEDYEDVKRELDKKTIQYEGTSGALGQAEAEIERRTSVEQSLRQEISELKEQAALLNTLLEERRGRNIIQRLFNAD